MRRSPSLLFRSTSYVYSNGKAIHSRPPIIKIENATFYRQYPSAGPPAGQTAASNPPLFPGLTFSLPSFPSEPQHWSILGPSGAGKTSFLEVLRGQHLCFPPGGRSYPYLSSDEIAAKDHRLRFPGRAFQYVGFQGEPGDWGGSGTRGAYLSARYESRREETDFSLLDYLKGHTELNPSDEQEGRGTADAMLERVIKDLSLEELVDMPVGNLSNGQTRRARIAKALLGQPEVLLLDEPFMGLDPVTLTRLSPLLHGLAVANAPRLVLSLRQQDPLPDWITHVIYLDQDCKIAHHGRKEEVLIKLRRHIASAEKRPGVNDADLPIYSALEIGRTLTSKGVFAGHAYSSSTATPSTMDEHKDGRSDVEKFPPEGMTNKDGVKKGYHPKSLQVARLIDTNAEELGCNDSLREPLVKMEGVCVKYGDKEVLGGWKQMVDGGQRKGLWWTVRRGDRWGIFGPNGESCSKSTDLPDLLLVGSGKTTILSLICSDHPQTYALPIDLFGRSRLPKPGQPGISIFDIQARIGHSSPEIHNFFPRNLSVRQTLENAWADTFLSKPQLNHHRDSDVDACLRWFHAELNPSSRPTPEEEPTRQDSKVMLPQESSIYREITQRSKRELRQVEAADIDWADELRFGEMSLSAQRVALFLRAIIKKPDLVILDEAFSGMDDYVRDRCKLFLAYGQERSWVFFKQDKKRRESKVASRSRWSRSGEVRISGLSQEQALICVSHVKEEVPGVVREWMCLPEANEGKPARFGRLGSPLEGNWRKWDGIWGM
ncbi:MAG: hypothetical protein M1830_001037 [Pleopsidium flavum]|nr:MAG: hypothetical protein M1830_001037 [Pleopsidium flavum]